MVTSWTDISKASGTAFTKVPKATGVDHSVTVNEGVPIGLLIALTYATTSSIVTGIWTDISKASGNAWTDIPKAT